MRVTSCAKGHFYDGEKFDVCPYCNGQGETVTTPAVPTDGTIPVPPMNPQISYAPPTGVPGPENDDGGEVTVSYADSRRIGRHGASLRGGDKI